MSRFICEERIRASYYCWSGRDGDTRDVEGRGDRRDREIGGQREV